ncbi:hypothetical protein, partial [Metabacillus idriensis]|uniref:hypothetical protein n=1 Tax=Metabacillus idriensis TaxID=324768 RepID=UPI003D29A0C7
RNRLFRPRNQFRIDGVFNLIGGVWELIDRVSELIHGVWELIDRVSELIHGVCELIGGFHSCRGVWRWSWTPQKADTTG